MSRRLRSSSPRSRSGFTLVELVMAIAVLAVAGVFIVQVFLSADRLATKASDLDRAVALCTSSVDAWKAGESPLSLDAIPVLSLAGSEMSSSATVHLDVRMEPTPDKESAAFSLSARLALDGDLVRLTIAVTSTGRTEPLFSMEAARWAGPSPKGSP